jgi:hypothetical protein
MSPAVRNGNPTAKIRKLSSSSVPPHSGSQVKPFPEQGRPKSFQGAVGNFRISAVLDKQAVKQNEPVTLKLVIEGEGNIETLNKPALPDVPEFKIYDADTSAQLFKTGSVSGGRKTFEIVYIPLKAGTLAIPALEFSFFDPAREAYRTERTPVFPLSVSPSDRPFKLPKSLSQQEILKKEIRLEAKDIRYLHERPPDAGGRGLGRILVRGLAGLDLALSLALLFGLLRLREERLFASNSALRRKRLARSQAQARIRKLGRKPAAAPSGYFDEIEKILTQYLSDKFNLSPHGVTRPELERHLERTLGAEDALRRDLQELYRLTDEARFGKAKLPEDLRGRALKILRETMSRVERMRL